VIRAGSPLVFILRRIAVNNFRDNDVPAKNSNFTCKLTNQIVGPRNKIRYD